MFFKASVNELHYKKGRYSLYERPTPLIRKCPCDLLQVMEYLHEMRFVHMDLRTENVLIWGL